MSTPLAPAGAPKGWARTLLTHRRWVLIAWIVILLLMAPAAVLYQNYVNYSSTGTTVAGSQSAQAASLLAQANPQRSTLFVVVQNATTPGPAYCNSTYGLARALERAHLRYFNSTSSVCSALAGALDSILDPVRPALVANGSLLRDLSNVAWAFPSGFWANWSGALQTINSTYNRSGGPSTGYPQAFRQSLLENYSVGTPAADQVTEAVRATALPYLPDPAAGRFLLARTTVINATSSIPTLVGEWLAQGGITIFGYPIPGPLVEAFIGPGDGGVRFVTTEGWQFAPASLRAPFVSPNGQVSLIYVRFSVADGFRGPDNFYPAQAAVPEIRTAAAAFFGPAAGVAGNGAVSYDSQAASNSDGFLFGVIFIFLAVAVFLTLRSWVAPILAVLFVGTGTLFGYFGILVTGALLGPVNYIVTYVLTAVVLGIATDFLVFLLYRYREGLREGRAPERALERATQTAGGAILTSAVTVAAGLGALSFLPGISTWGPVLFITVLLVGICEATLLPVIASYIGPRLFLARGRARSSRPLEASPFYRAADASVRHRWAVLAIVVIVAVPAVVAALTVPTSYDITQGLPASFPSVQAQNAIESAFGANLLFPTTVLVHDPAGYLAANGSLTPSGIAILYRAAAAMHTTSGLASGTGPFLLGRDLAPNSTAGATLSGATGYIFPNGTWAYWNLFSVASPFSDGGSAFVQALRVHPGWIVGGAAAGVVDQKAQNQVLYPELELLIVVLIGMVLGIAFRSLVYPLISLSGVYLSITATTVLLYVISTDLLHEALIYLIPLILFVILVSLGNDYTVFILSRVVEEGQREPPRRAIPRGIGFSGAVVTSLGLILAASLGSLGLQPLGFLQQLGIAFAISLVIDTFLVRLFYFPAVLSITARRSSGPGAP
ncbi:MAG: MMPL family transporter [Thermoplasmata archaeon]